MNRVFTQKISHCAILSMCMLTFITPANAEDSTVAPQIANEPRLLFSYISSGYRWKGGGINTGIYPDGVVYAYHAHNPWEGKYAFLDQTMSIEFVAYITYLSGPELTLSTQKQAFYDLLVHRIGFADGPLQSNFGTLQIVSACLKDQQDYSRQAWQAAYDQQKEIKLTDHKALIFRVRLTLSPLERQVIFSKGDDVFLQLKLGIDLGQLEGNEQLIPVFEKRKGSPREMFFPTVTFRLVKQSYHQQNDMMKAAYAHWQIMHAREDMQRRWQWREKLLELQPRNEREHMNYARDLFLEHEYAKAVEVGNRLVKVIGQRPGTSYPIRQINSTALGNAFAPVFIGCGVGYTPPNIPPEQLIADLQMVIRRVEDHYLQTDSSP